MPGKHNAGGCGCCLPTGCPQCDGITYLIISDLDSGGTCPDGCEDQNGTYVFRSPGDPIDGGCQWVVTLNSSNCGHSCGGGDTDLWDIGLVACCLITAQRQFTVTLSYSGTAVKVTVDGAFTYHIVRPDCSGYGTDGPTSCGSYSAKWEKEFADCASISGTLPLVLTDGYACNVDYDDTGDLCGLFGATVEVG